MNYLRIGLMSAALVAGVATASSQTVAADSVMQHVNGKRLSIGGYGEVALSRNFYSDAGKRYSNATAYKNAPDHGRFDIPHAVIYLGYNFGKGWTMGTEIEFEHGGTGLSIEYEAEEAIEYEQEVEKGGEVELEQFWIQKSFGKWANVKPNESGSGKYFGSHAIATMVEAGYDVFSQISKLREDKQVQEGKKLFMSWGCASCHKPSWKTGDDNYVTSKYLADKKLPRYQNQTIYPYSDFVQHKLYMMNDIHGSWCRTTPLWGRGLSYLNTGAEDRLHDCRARNEVEAIMWHCYSKKSHAYSSAMNFYKASKSERDAVVKFLRSI